jgi:DNA-binding FrmR family transcriptional regulator
MSDLRVVIAEAADAIVSYEDRQLRKRLQWAEGKLDSLEHTTECHELFSAVMDVVTAVEEEVSKALQP